MSYFLSNTYKEIAFPVIDETICDVIRMQSAISSVNFLSVSVCVCVFVCAEEEKETHLKRKRFVLHPER